jgi:hypothetical protein
VVTHTRVVLLTNRSLFAEGVASRLRQALAEHELQTVDARQADALDLIVKIQPHAVILDGTDPEVTQHCPLGTLLGALPSLTVIRLDPEHDVIQVVTSEQRDAGRVQDLLAVIGNQP